jgi:hypothetical protein
MYSIMNSILDHGTMIWAVLAVVGLIACALIASVGGFAVFRGFERARSIGRPGAFAWAGFAAAGFAFSVVLLFAAYFLGIGVLSFFLFRS